MLDWILILIGIIIAAWLVFALIKGIMKLAIVAGIIFLVIISGVFVWNLFSNDSQQITGKTIDEIKENDIITNVQEKGEQIFNDSKEKIEKIILD